MDGRSYENKDKYDPIPKPTVIETFKAFPMPLALEQTKEVSDIQKVFSTMVFPIFPIPENISVPNEAPDIDTLTTEVVGPLTVLILVMETLSYEAMVVTEAILDPRVAVSGKLLKNPALILHNSIVSDTQAVLKAGVWPTLALMQYLPRCAKTSIK